MPRDPCFTPGPTAAGSQHHAAAGRSADVLAYVDVLHALCALDRVDRAALRLVYWHGRTHAQVADELGMSLEAVRLVVARGMRRVADYLCVQGPPEDSRSGPGPTTPP